MNASCPQPALRIVWLSVNASYSHSSFALACIHAAAASDLPAAEWDHVTATIKDDEWGVLRRLCGTGPDLVAATLYLFNRDKTLAILRRFARLHPEIPIVLGGPEFLGDNQAFLRENPFVAAVFRGEAEGEFAKFANRLRTPQSWADVRGLCWVDAGCVYRDHDLAVVPEPLDALPSPTASRFFDFDKPFVSLETSRGCPGRCSFCTSCRFGAPRYFSLDRVARDLECLRHRGVCDVRILDRTFNLPVARCLELLALLRRHVDVMRFHLEVNPAALTDAVAAALADFPPGRLHLEAGLQTGCAEALTAVSRAGDAQRAWAGIRRLCELRNLDVHVDLIAGLPGAGLADVYEDLCRLTLLGPDEIQLEVLKLLPGTPLRDRAEAGGADDMVFNPAAPYEILRTSHMSFEDLNEVRLLSRAVDSFHNEPGLRGAVRLGVESAGRGFWERILRLGINDRGEPMPMSLTRRFTLLHQACSDLAGVVQALEYRWMADGMGVRDGLVAAELWKESVPETATCVAGDAAVIHRPCRVWSCEIGGVRHWFVYTRESQERTAVAVCREVDGVG